MQINSPFTKMGIPLSVALGNIILTVSAFVWYYCASAILRDIIDEVYVAYGEKLIFYTVLFLSLVVSILIGASLEDKLTDRKRFLTVWIFFGGVSSLALLLLENATTFNMLLLLFLVGAALGIGLPIYMAIFKETTEERNRARFGSIVIFSMFLGVAIFELISPASLPLKVFLLLAWRFSGLVGISLLRNYFEIKKQRRSVSMISLFKDRSVLLYLVPWTVFSMVNYLGWPINSKIHGENFVYFSALINILVAGIFALIAGFLADNIGRKRTVILGFVIFGLGYAALGMSPFNMYAWYLYTVVDGIAWGIIYVIFWFTIWGDLAREKSSEKYYAIGLLPYALSGFLRVTLGPFIANTVSEYAIFSFAAFFLFLAVVPLMYAPETLPEKVIRERELKSYIEKARKIREKYERQKGD